MHRLFLFSFLLVFAASIVLPVAEQLAKGAFGPVFLLEYSDQAEKEKEECRDTADPNSSGASVRTNILQLIRSKKPPCSAEEPFLSRLYAFAPEHPPQPE